MAVTKKDIYQNAKLRFEVGNLFEAFETLVEGLSPVSFLEYFSKKETDKTSWLNKNSAKDYFWNDYLLKNSKLEYFNKEIVFQKLLKFYFINYGFSSTKFEAILVNYYPNEFIKAIRLNCLYLDPSKQEWLTNLVLPHEHFLQKIVWNEFYTLENKLWDSVEEAFENIKSYSIEDILATCSIWLEEERYKLGKERSGNLANAFQVLGATYGKFIDLLQLSKKLNENFDQDLFITAFVNLLKNDVSEIKKKITTLFNSIMDWVKFKDIYLDTYSFDFNSELVLENENIFIVTPEKNYIKWKKDGARYEFIKDRYFNLANEICNAENETIPGKTTLEKDANYNIQLERLSLFCVLKDLGITDFTINEKRYSVESIITPLLVYSGNRELRYNRGLKDISQFSKSWKHDYLYLQFKHGSKLDCSPYILHSEQEFAKLNQEGIGRLEVEQYKEGLTYFIYDTKKTKFNRFKKGYNVYFNPLLKIGDILFCPIFFFSSSTWFYAILQKAISIKQPERTETENVELNLKTLFNQSGFNVFTFNYEQVNNMDGDIDLIVEDENISLLIQIKRSCLRTSLVDYWEEKLNAELKAAQQLNDAEVFLSNNPELYSLKKTVIKWIVSTSFEGVNEMLEGCRKVNYFELISFLQQNQIKNLNELILFFEQDNYLKIALEYNLKKFNNDLSKMSLGENKVLLGNIKEFV